MSIDTQARPTGEPVVGTRMTGRSRTIAEADLVGFAGLTGDWHPQHVDSEWAGASMFGERVAHGMAILSYSIGLIDFDPERVVALRGLDGVRFKRPVPIGETISVEAVVREVREIDAHLALVGFGWTVRTAAGATAIKASVQVLWRRDESERPDEAEADPDPDMERTEEGDYLLYPGGLLL